VHQAPKSTRRLLAMLVALASGLIAVNTGTAGVPAGGLDPTWRAWTTSDTCGTVPGGLLAQLKAAVSTDTLRRRIWSLSSMSADSVTAVSDTSICRRAAIAVGRSLTPPDSTTPRTAAVIRVGSSYYVAYVVNDTTLNGGEWLSAFKFSSSLTGNALLTIGF